MVIEYKTVDYKDGKFYTVTVDIGQPTIGCVNVFDDIGEEIAFNNVMFELNEKHAIYQAKIITPVSTIITEIIDIKYKENK